MSFRRTSPSARAVLPLLIAFTIIIPSSTYAIQCYSGNQFNIIECPSLHCIKQTLGLDTVRYCDGTGVSSICSTYRIIDTCQSVTNLGYICCCSDQLCNSVVPNVSLNKLHIVLPAIGLAIWSTVGLIRTKML